MLPDGLVNQVQLWVYGGAVVAVVMMLSVGFVLVVNDLVKGKKR